MDNLDKMISDALDGEELEILKKIGHEPSFPAQAIGLFHGRIGWLNGAVLLMHLLFVAGGVYAAWRFFTMREVLDAVRWGLPAAVLLLAALHTRIALIRSMQTNRVIHAVKILEAKVALLAANWHSGSK